MQRLNHNHNNDKPSLIPSACGGTRHLALLANILHLVKDKLAKLVWHKQIIAYKNDTFRAIRSQQFLLYAAFEYRHSFMIS